MLQSILDKITSTYSNCPFIYAIVLGGSRATESETNNSDIDIGIYYEREKIDYAVLNEIAQQLDDQHREQLICQEGEWGQWVNCGGWLIVDGFHVDIIMRDWEKVKAVVQTTELGICTCHYQTGHPHTFMDVMYRGELASCKVLYANGIDFHQVKHQAEIYPSVLRKALIDFFLFEAGFSCLFLENNSKSGDTYYLAGQVFRSISSLNQVLFALNCTWLLNEKKAVFRIEKFSLRPLNYSQRINDIFDNVLSNPVISAQILRELCNETEKLCANINL